LRLNNLEREREREREEKAGRGEKSVIRRRDKKGWISVLLHPSIQHGQFSFFRV
jgi:hypothetical protein